MLKNYFKIAWRNLMKSKLFSFINIAGLSIGITACLMIFLFVKHEFSVDRFHTQGDRIYRVMRGVEQDGGGRKVSYLSAPYAPALLNDFKDEIKRAVRVRPNDGLASIGDRSFREEKIYDVDADFFQLFSFPLIRGNAATVLKDPASVVLTETTAKKYFGSVDHAMGKVIELNKYLPLKVTGIAKDVPSNSHLDFDLIVPFSNYEQQEGMKVWINNSLYTYVLLNPDADPKKIESQFSSFMNKYMGEDMRQFGYKFTLSLMPLKDVYFDHASFDGARHTDQKVVYIFLSIALLILLIACINFMNLSTIRAIERAKEVGMRKVLGALRKQLVGQFIGESLLLTSFACLISLGLLVLSMPLYSQLLGYQLSFSWGNSYLWLFLICLVLFIGLVAGSYPAFFLSTFSPIQALKEKLKLGRGAFFRQALVVVQFSISVFLVIGTIVISNQMSYIKNKNLGYDEAQTLIIPVNNGAIYDHLHSFKIDLQKESAVASVSVMSGEPGGFFDEQIFEVDEHSEKWRGRTVFADVDYVKTLGLKVIAGRDLSPAYATDSTDAVLINRTAAAKLGWDPDLALGKWIRNTVRDDHRRKIVGVVEDFNFVSLKEIVQPLVISPNEDWRVILIKLNAGNLKSGIDLVKRTYEKSAPDYPFEYRFLDQQFDKLYQNDLRQQTLLSVFAGLAIFIACLGLFGLASFAATKRIKEIGVRKVLGSSSQEIVILLSKDLIKPVLIATCLAIPISYYVMYNWLQSFAYRISMHWWIFLFAALITFIIALTTVGIKAVKAALANPVDSLRNE
ncbi:ABC transporter permease [Olivibacter domesticus]|uniref:Putative ABC transport system permease protein n=1 Tax=Olivibacter domesticus TaxID=407022 RepID=A0A1H7SF52_OLID1|nr:ABC transporter permease [Olivibacter domesticus]SEL71270.1 putative ABC transport system permease protein [Olivibacter domesticus]